MTTLRAVTVGTRTSPLSLVQTDEVLSYLREHFPHTKFIVAPISTSGDRKKDAPLLSLGRGTFVKEIELVLLNETIDLAVQRGAQGGVVYTDEGWAKTLGKAAGPIDVVFDGAPAGGFPAYVRTLAMGARVVVYGSTAGPVFKASAPDIFLRNLSIIGTNVGNQKEFGEMLDFVGQHRLVPLVDRSFAFEEAADALRNDETVQRAYLGL